MSTPRESFLESVRKAVGTGNRPGVSPALEPRNGIGYQGAGADPVGRFRDELLAAGGHFHPVTDSASAVARVLDLVQTHVARRILLGRGTFLDSLPLAERLRGLGLEVQIVDDLAGEAARDVVFAADLGISGVNYLIAETGTVALFAGQDEPRSLSLLPPVHIAVADRGQLLPDLFDLFAAVPQPPPSCVSLITGPSKTGDIELRLVTGVHGPGEIHVVLVDPPG
jgi:L-lactate utilization protein LutC